MILGYLFLIFPIMAILSLFIYFPIFLLRRKAKGKQPFIRHLVCYGLIGVVLSILYITIFLIGGEISLNPNLNRLNLVPFSWLKSAWQSGRNFVINQLVLNIIMFIPLGILLPVVFKSLSKWWKTAMVTVAVTAAIEVLQLFIGRSGDIDDILMNYAGGMIGYILFVLFRSKFKNRSWWIKATDTLSS